jgi:hypothetical protein
MKTKTYSLIILIALFCRMLPGYKSHKKLDRPIFNP